MCVNNLCKIALDSAVAWIEPVISNRKSNAMTVMLLLLILYHYLVIVVVSKYFFILSNPDKSRG